MIGDPLNGKRQAIFIACIFLSISALVISSYNLTKGHDRLNEQIFRFILLAILCLFLCLGHNWARWLLGIFSGLAVLVGVLGVAFLISKGNIIGAGIPGLLIPAYGYCFARLFFSHDLISFIKSGEKSCSR
jgi:hypothetical protein